MNNEQRKKPARVFVKERLKKRYRKAARKRLRRVHDAQCDETSEQRVQNITKKVDFSITDIKIISWLPN